MTGKKATEEQQSAVMPEALRKAIERMKGQKSEGEAVKVPVEEAFPLAAEAMRKAAAEEIDRRKAEEEAWRNPQPGQKMADGTIFMGQRQILGKIFNAYAAAEDMTKKQMSYDDTVDYIAKEYKGHGYNGGYYGTDQDLYAAIQNNVYKGEWFMPPRDFVVGKGTVDNTITLYSLKDHDGFKNTLKTAGTSIADWYWTSTRFPGGEISHTWTVRLSDGCALGRGIWGDDRLSCRPVRLMELK